MPCCCGSAAAAARLRKVPFAALTPSLPTSPASSLRDNLYPSGPYAAPGRLMEIAEQNRADLKAAELSHTLSQKNLALVRASRAMELGFEVGYSYNTEVRNEIAPAPAFNGLTFGVSIPLKFSSLNRGERAAAEASVSQAEHYLQAARLAAAAHLQAALGVE